jgi:hypothetical protein
MNHKDRIDKNIVGSIVIVIYLILASFLLALPNNEKKDDKVEKSMKKQLNMMEKFDFLLGSWNLEYRVPKSALSEEDSGTGTGTFKRALNDKYVYFDYSARLTKGQGAAHAIFAWDSKAGIYRYWWFEDSGNFLTATCNFINDETLFLNWHDTLLIQTFTKDSPDKVIVRMEHPASEGKYELILEVLFTR